MLRRQHEAIAALLGAGVPPDVKNQRRWNPIDEAVALGDAEAVKILYRCGEREGGGGDQAPWGGPNMPRRCTGNARPPRPTPPPLPRVQPAACECQAGQASKETAAGGHPGAAARLHDAGEGVDAWCACAGVVVGMGMVLVLMSGWTPSTADLIVGFMVVVQLRWELGSPIFGWLLRHYAPDDTYHCTKVGGSHAVYHAVHLDARAGHTAYAAASGRWATASGSMER